MPHHGYLDPIHEDAKRERQLGTWSYLSMISILGEFNKLHLLTHPSITVVFKVGLISDSADLIPSLEDPSFSLGLARPKNFRIVGD